MPRAPFLAAPQPQLAPRCRAPAAWPPPTSQRPLRLPWPAPHSGGQAWTGLRNCNKQLGWPRRPRTCKLRIATCCARGPASTWAEAVLGPPVDPRGLDLGRNGPGAAARERPRAQSLASGRNAPLPARPRPCPCRGGMRPRRRESIDSSARAGPGAVTLPRLPPRPPSGSQPSWVQRSRPRCSCDLEPTWLKVSCDGVCHPARRLARGNGNVWARASRDL